MQLRRFGNRLIARIDSGEEIVETIKQICKNNHIRTGWIQGIGAIDKASLGIFIKNTRKYELIELSGDYEITNLTGNISSLRGETHLHLHITLCNNSFQTFGGHLNSAYVSGTCEVYISSIEGNIEREFNDKVGLNIFKM